MRAWLGILINSPLNLGETSGAGSGAMLHVGARPPASWESSKGPVALRPSGCRDDEGDLGVQSLGGGERPIVLKFTGAAIDLDRIESHPCCRLLLTKSVEQCLIRGLIVRKNHAVSSAHKSRRVRSGFVVKESTKQLGE